MSIQRSEVLNRARTLWTPGSHRYSQDVIVDPGYRPDCSGAVSLWLGIPPTAEGSWGGMNTATLVTSGYVHEIPIDDLTAGDLVGKLGPGSEGDAGHVQLFVSWDSLGTPDNGHTVIEMTPPDGPHENHYADWTPGYRAYRYRGIVDDPRPGRPFPYQYPPNYIGDVAGPDESHGGYWPAERLDVARCQRALIRAGAVPGITNPFDPWADGIFDYWPANGQHPTTDAVRVFQRQHGLTIDGQIGPETWAALQPYMVD